MLPVRIPGIEGDCCSVCQSVRSCFRVNLEITELLLSCLIESSALVDWICRMCRHTEVASCAWTCLKCVLKKHTPFNRLKELNLSLINVQVKTTPVCFLLFITALQIPTFCECLAQLASKLNRKSWSTLLSSTINTLYFIYFWALNLVGFRVFKKSKVLWNVVNVKKQAG